MNATCYLTAFRRDEIYLVSFHFLAQSTTPCGLYISLYDLLLEKCFIVGHRLLKIRSVRTARKHEVCLIADNKLLFYLRRFANF